MNDHQRAAFLQSRCTCAIIEALAILSEQGEHPRDKRIRILIEKYAIGESAVRDYLTAAAGREDRLA